MLEDNKELNLQEEKRKYFEIIIRQYKPLIFGILSTVCLVLASLEIVASIFFIFALAFLMATIITIITAQKRNVRRLRLI